MKTWLFALLESVIALLALSAYFLADNVSLATAAAVLAAGLGFCQPLISAAKGHKLRVYQDRQFQSSLDAVDDQLQALLDDVIEPPLPFRPTVAAVLRGRFGQRSGELLEEFDRVSAAIAASRPDAPALAAEFAARLAPWPLGPYLQGLAALADGDAGTAHALFLAAARAQPGWISPWLGWAATANRQGRWDELREQHPHITGVELSPYDAGDEESFLHLDEQQRAELAQQFQLAATSLGNYYAVAELRRTQTQIADSRAELKKAAA